MRRVEIYVDSDTMTPRRTQRAVGYVLEYVHNGQPYTRDHFAITTATYHGAVLSMLIDALGRMREACEIHVHTRDAYILTALEKNLKIWQGRDFLTARGQPITDRDEWMRLQTLIPDHLIVPEQGKYDYLPWMIWKMQHLAREPPHSSK